MTTLHIEDFGPCDNDSLLIQAAIDAAEDGDEILFARRVYLLSSKIHIQRSIKLVGDKAMTKMRPSFGTKFDFLIATDPSDNSVFFIEPSSPPCRLENFNFKGVTDLGIPTMAFDL